MGRHYVSKKRMPEGDRRVQNHMRERPVISTANPMSRYELDSFIAALRYTAIRARQISVAIDKELDRLEARRKTDGSKPNRTRRRVTKA